jgi:hypothetical protein
LRTAPGLALLGGDASLFRGRLARGALGGDPLRLLALLPVALGFVFVAAVDALLLRGERVDLEDAASLSAVSSSTELEAVFTSTPSFFRRSMTSWLESFRSRASPKTLTFAIRPTLLGSTLRRRGGRLGRNA